MSDTILALDTSNYRTSAAFYRASDSSWRSYGKMLDVKPGSLGLRQNDALFQHIKAIPDVLTELFSSQPRLIVGSVAYSDRPRDVDGSYMPCFLAGACAAKSIAATLGVPVHAFSHQQGHIASALFSAGRLDLLDKPFLAWHLSGGTTELLIIRPDAKRIIAADIIGGTSDISAGQLIDRTGVMLGMQFPAGAEVDAMAGDYSDEKPARVKVHNCVFSLSGIENQVKSRIHLPPGQVCAYALGTIAHAVITATLQARRTHDLPVLVSGGVSASNMLREALQTLPDIIFAEQGLGGDNALGPAILTAYKTGQLAPQRVDKT